MTLLLRWLITAAAVWVAVRLIPGISLEDGVTPLLAVSVILGGVNALVRPILNFLACGIIFLTLGLFLLVVNAAMLILTAWVAQNVGVPFHVDGFLSALLGSLVISFVSAVASSVLIPERDDGR